MDLVTAAAIRGTDDGVPMTVVHPGTGMPYLDDAGETVRIWLCGKDSKRYQKAQDEIVDRNIKAGKRLKVNAELLKQQGTELLAKVTTKWEGVTMQGQSLPCNFENAKNAYSIPWLREQVEEFIEERANFLTNSSENS